MDTFLPIGVITTEVPDVPKVPYGGTLKAKDKNKRYRRGGKFIKVLHF